MSWQKVVTYTPYEYKQEMKRRGLLMILFTIVFIVALVGFGVWWSNQIQSTSNQIQSMSWGSSGFTANNSQALLISSVVCNSTGFYLKASANTGRILGIFVAPINSSNVNEKGDFNIIHSDSFSIWSLPYMTCNSGQKYWANITAIDIIGTSYLKVSGIVWGIGNACQFLQGSINCNP